MFSNCSIYHSLYFAVSRVEISHVVSENVTEAVIYLKSALPEQTRYHLGYRIQTKRTISDENVKEELFDFYTGVSVLKFSVDVYKWYKATVWPLTHEGYGESKSVEFQSAGKGLYLFLFYFCSCSTAL